VVFSYQIADSIKSGELVPLLQQPRRSQSVELVKVIMADSKASVGGG
jgi:hypothetical protein